MDQPDDSFYSADDAVGAFESLSDLERRNLTRAAKALAGEGRFASPHELLNEAYVRIAEGRRPWPKSHAFASFVTGVMKSLLTDRMFLTDERKVKALKNKFAVVGIEDMDTVAAPPDGAFAGEKALLEDAMSKLAAHFAGDEEMELLLMGLNDCLIGQALQEAVGVDTKRLAALRTRLNRQIDKLASEYLAKEGRS
ncbi:transposase [Hyphomicrobium sp.]|uniref:transposase n=1 Tax=Hyphomicrobium sp. TaxID=82 RepID=UPI001DCB513D|nr:transposase [Hyphomicrobium sp.]MBY0560129.1 transposase [Hyphomicrobium sp.]